MGKGKKGVIISGFNLDDVNRGTAALGYGSISFLQNHYGLTNDCELINIKLNKNLWAIGKRKDKVCRVRINGQDWNHRELIVFWPTYQVLKRLCILLPFTKIRKVLKNIQYVAAINGGDGFSDIYGNDMFKGRLAETIMAMKAKVPVIQLPQTIGPFRDSTNYELAKKILLYSKDVYVRDKKYIAELDRMGVDYVLTKDLSYFMLPEPWDIDIKEGAIGLNVSGLAYSNSFKTLAGEFGEYRYLCKKIVSYFQKIGKTIYLISHSYKYGDPEVDNDDMESARDFYHNLENKNGVVLVDKDLNSPKTKYLISKMSFFVGTRMHANFAAIYTNVPVFGLAYSYKFKGAFDANGLDGDKQTAMINNISKVQADSIVEKVVSFYSNINKKFL